MPYVSHQYQFIFYSAPATGSTAVIDALFESLGGEMYPQKDVIVDGKRAVPRKHATPAQMYDNGLMEGPISKYESIVGVRNPFSFHVAKYLRNINTRSRQAKDPDSWINKLPKLERERYINNINRQLNMSFSEYLLREFRGYKEPKAPQNHFTDYVKYFVRQENIQEDINKILFNFGITRTIFVRKINVTNALKENQTYKDFYDEKLIEMVYKWNEPFFRKFPEYSFSGINTKSAV